MRLQRGFAPCCVHRSRRKFNFSLNNVNSPDQSAASAGAVCALRAGAKMQRMLAAAWQGARSLSVLRSSSVARAQGSASCCICACTARWCACACLQHTHGMLAAHARPRCSSLAVAVGRCACRHGITPAGEGVCCSSSGRLPTPQLSLNHEKPTPCLSSSAHRCRDRACESRPLPLRCICR